MLRAIVAAACLVTLAGCSSTLEGRALPPETPTSQAPSADSTAPAGSDSGSTSCIVNDQCGDSGSEDVPAELVCSPLPTAMSAFDHQAGSRFAGGQVPTYASDATLSVLDDLVIQVVDRCGFQVMADIAYQYPAPLYGWFLATAASALGEISTLPPGLRCADLAALGWGPKQAVDYWFLWNGPDLMDADLNGIPCQTVWPGVDRYMPAYY